MFHSAVICGPESCKRDEIMKTRLATNIDGYALRMALLFEYTYSDCADLILVVEILIKSLVRILAYVLFLRSRSAFRNHHKGAG